MLLMTTANKITTRLVPRFLNILAYLYFLFQTGKITKKTFKFLAIKFPYFHREFRALFMTSLFAFLPFHTEKGNIPIAPKLGAEV